MFGFLGLMTVLLSLIGVISYWISWDLLPKDQRPAFMTKVRQDFADLVSRYVRSARPAGLISTTLNATREPVADNRESLAVSGKS